MIHYSTDHSHLLIKFWHHLLPLVHAHIMYCTLMHKMNERPIVETEGSQDEQSIGSDIQQPEATHIHTKTRLERGGSIRKVDQDSYKCTRQNRKYMYHNDNTTTM